MVEGVPLDVYIRQLVAEEVAKKSIEPQISYGFV